MTEIQEYLINTIKKMDEETKLTLQAQTEEILLLKNKLELLQSNLDVWSQLVENLITEVSSFSASYNNLLQLCQNIRK